MSYQLIETHEHFKDNLETDYGISNGNHEFVFKENKNKNKNKTYRSFILRKDENKCHLETDYFIGVDWIEEKKCALYVAPKLDKETAETDYVKMLFDAMQHVEKEEHLKDLYKIEWKKPSIEITQQQDLLTPFLITEFLGIVKQIVRKGLKKSYYKVEQKLNSRIKGKINIGKTVKHQLSKQKMLETVCTFEEFGVDNLENRILKKALEFIKRYLPQYHNIGESEYLQNMFNFITPAFHQVSTEVSVRDIQSFKSNAFFKEYDRGLELAKMILKRFGYNISKTEEKKIQTPPFWIDMSKLFELYVLGMLKDRFGKAVIFQFPIQKTTLDYLLNSTEKDKKDLEYKMVIDAKYKLIYETDRKDTNNIRQISGYARASKVYKTLGKEYPESIDCLIIYPINNSVKDDDSFKSLNNRELREEKIKFYEGFYKIGVQLPKIENRNQ